MKNKIRAIVFQKFGGKCAYCGVDLVKGWNVDHIKPQVFGGTNDLDNLNPSCKDCNNYKCHTDLEGYRKQLHKMLNEKLEYLFKSKTKMQVAMNMGSIKHSFWDGKFYFERALEKHIEELNVDKLLDDFHEWIELNEWDFCPVSFNGAIKYRWSTETYSQATTKELYEIFLSQK